MTQEQTDYEKKLEERQKNSAMLYVGGSKTSFSCYDCGANVFYKLDNNRYECNGCGTVYHGEE